MKWILPLSLTLLLPSYAQDQTQASEDTLKVYYLDEVVVVGTRGGGETLKVPMAVGVVTRNDLTTVRQIGLNEALRFVPGVLAQSRSGGQDVRLTIRGFGARGNGDRSNAATIRGIKVLIDGIPESDPDGRTALDLVDLFATSRIEVVRTNLSTLFGNASGGIINLETFGSATKPHLATRNLFGSFGLRKNNLSLTTPLASGEIAVSLSNMAFDGWRENSAGSSTHLHSMFASKPDDRTSMRLFVSGTDNAFHIPGPLTEIEYAADAQQANPVYVSRRERRENQIARFALKVERTLSERGGLSAIAYYSPKILVRSERNTYRDFNRYHAGTGVTYQWGDAEKSWKPSMMIGGDAAYQDGTILFYNLRNGERGDSLRTNKREGAGTYGAFVQGSVDPFENASVVVGGRYDWQDYQSEVYPAGAKRTQTSERLTMSHFTPRAALMIRLSPSRTIYLSLSGGVEAPAFNEVDPPPGVRAAELNPLLKPMKSSTYEIGFKGIEMLEGDVPQGSVSYSISLYRINVRDEIVPFDGGAWFFSAGASRRNGGEIGLEVDLRNGLSLRSALTLLDAEYTSYQNELGNFAGREVPGIPFINAQVRVRYRKSGFSLELSAEHVGRSYTDDANAIDIPSSVVLNSAASYSFRLGPTRTRFVLGVQNLTDEKYIGSAFINPTRRNVGGTLLPAYIEAGLPRNTYVGLDVGVDL